ncbi:MAG: aminotransferase class I/II-fold pyridoxal phosphate-dependent enzyme, partial [Sphingomonadaceae bacterium]
DLDDGQWREIAELVERRGLVPLIDMAYQGLGAGLDADAKGVRLLMESVPAGLVAASCSKSFSLYRERTGMLMVKTAGAETADLVRSNIQSLARLNYSNPPDHGAAIVRTILENAELKSGWQAGLEQMRLRIAGVRAALAASDGGAIDFSLAGRHKGLFALLPLSPAMTECLRREHGIYMARSGRINLAGLNDRTIERFVTAVRVVAGAHPVPITDRV